MKNFVIILIVVLLLYFGLKNKDKIISLFSNEEPKKQPTDSITGVAQPNSWLSADIIYFYRKSDCTLFIDADQSRANEISTALSGYSGTNYASKYNAENHKSWRRLFDFRPSKSGLTCLCKCNTNKQVQKLLDMGAIENSKIL